MTDQTPVSVTSAPRHTVDFVHELFWEQIRRLFADELQRSQARMGTVSGVTGTSLLVLPDGSAVPRALPHVAGRRFAIGQRVIIAPVQGLPMVVGGVLTAAGSAEGVIETIDLGPGLQGTLAIFNRGINDLSNGFAAHSESIAALGTGVANAQISANNAQGTANIAIDRANDAQFSAGVADVHAQNARTLANNAQGTADIAIDRASNAQYLASSADVHAQDVYNVLSNRLDRCKCPG